MRRISRSFVYSAALLFLLAAFAAGAPNQGVPYTLTLIAPKQPLNSGKPVILGVKVKNAWEQLIHVPVSRGGIWGCPGTVYKIYVLNEWGLPPPPWVALLPPKGEHVICAGSMPSMWLQPGQSKTDEVNVSEVYNLRRPGKYKIWIAGFFYRGPHLPDGLIKSNTITVTVVK